MKNIKIQNEFEIESKRFRLPISLKFICPHCGKKIERDMSGDDYLNYPYINRKERQEVFCHSCEKESHFYSRLEVSLDVSEKLEIDE